jgi:4-amino-4-deoxy-L-arabinose transferase-like glycosyltransferase
MSADAKLPLVAWLGLLVGVAMTAVSVTGLVGRLNTATVSLALAFAAGIAIALRPRFDVRLNARLPVLLLLILVALPAAAALAPPHTWDEVAYGAALPRDYARAGHFFYNADFGVISAFPANFEALTTASLILFGSVVPAQLLNVGLALGLAVIAAHLGRRLGLGGAASLLAGVFVLLAPALLAIASVVKNDIANAFFQALFLLALVHYVENPRASAAALAGFFLGTALGIKYSSLQFALCAGPIALFTLLAGPRPWVARGQHVAIFGAVCAGVALPWYLRTWMLLGNPVFPFYNDVLHARNGFTAEHSAMLAQMGQIVRDFSWATGTPAHFLKEVAREFGPVPLALAVPGLVLGLRGARRCLWLPLAALFVGYTVLTLRAGFWLPRYFLVLLLLASVLAAAACDGALRALGRHRGGRVAVGTLLALALWASRGVLQDQIIGDWIVARDLLVLDRPAFLAKHALYWELARWLNENTHEGDRIGIGVNVQPFYYLERSYFHIHPTSEKGDLLTARTPDDFLSRFRALGLTMLVVRKWDYREELGAGALTGRAPLMEEFLARFYDAVHELHAQGKIRRAVMISDARVYWIEPAPVDPTP